VGRMSYKVFRYGGKMDSVDVYGGPLSLDCPIIGHWLMYGANFSPDPAHAKHPSYLLPGEYTLGRAREGNKRLVGGCIYKVLAI